MTRRRLASWFFSERSRGVARPARALVLAGASVLCIACGTPLPTSSPGKPKQRAEAPAAKPASSAEAGLVASTAPVSSKMTEAKPAHTASPPPEATPEEPKPVIGVNGSFGSATELSKVEQRVQQAGGNVLRLVPDSPQAVDRIAGLVLVGGQDIDPKRYGEKPHKTVKLITKQRERFDFELAKAAMAKKIPTLGICLGGQELWVQEGGTLVQDIPSEIGAKVDHRARATRHAVQLTPNSLLHRIYGTLKLDVYSNHHQAPDAASVPDAFIVSATSSDGVVEAFESKEPDRFVVGLSWHAEHADAELALFEALVTAARSRAGQSQVSTSGL